MLSVFGCSIYEQINLHNKYKYIAYRNPDFFAKQSKWKELLLCFGLT